MAKAPPPGSEELPQRTEVIPSAAAMPWPARRDIATHSVSRLGFFPRGVGVRRLCTPAEFRPGLRVRNGRWSFVDDNIITDLFRSEFFRPSTNRIRITFGEVCRRPSTMWTRWRCEIRLFSVCLILSLVSGPVAGGGPGVDQQSGPERPQRLRERHEPADEESAIEAPGSEPFGLQLLQRSFGLLVRIMLSTRRRRPRRTVSFVGRSQRAARNISSGLSAGSGSFRGVSIYFAS